MSKRLIQVRRYIGEFNRPLRDDIRTRAQKLKGLGLNVEILRHKTALAICRPMTMSWDDFKKALRAILDPKRGSVLLFSQATGNAFRCDNRGNRPGRFVYA